MTRLVTRRPAIGSVQQRAKELDDARLLERRRALRDFFVSRGSDADEARRQAEYDVDVSDWRARTA